MAYRQEVKKRSLFSRLATSINKSDVMMPSFVIGGFVWAASSFVWGGIACIAMMYVLSEVANLKDEIRKK